MTYFHMATATLSSALSGFTTEFEMGSGGSHSLWSPGNSADRICSLFLTAIVQIRDSSRQTRERVKRYSYLSTDQPIQRQTAWVLYGQASRAISIR